MASSKRKDYSRQKGKYAIIDSTFKKRGGYMVVEVLGRDVDGNVTRIKQDVLSEQSSIEEAQRLLDTWEGIDNSGLVAHFEAWKQKRGLK